jgi:hypothetical protein
LQEFVDIFDVGDAEALGRGMGGCPVSPGHDGDLDPRHLSEVLQRERTW